MARASRSKRSEKGNKGLDPEKGRKLVKYIHEQSMKRLQYEKDRAAAAIAAQEAYAPPRTPAPTGRQSVSVSEGEGEEVNVVKQARDKVAQSQPQDPAVWKHRFDGIVAVCEAMRDRNAGNTMVSDYIMDTVIKEATNSMWAYRDVVLAVWNALDEIQHGVSEIRRVK